MVKYIMKTKTKYIFYHLYKYYKGESVCFSTKELKSGG